MDACDDDTWLVGRGHSAISADDTRVAHAFRASVEKCRLPLIDRERIQWIQKADDDDARR